MKRIDKIIVASGNAHKVREIREILGSQAGSIVSMAEAGISVEVEETGVTFDENAVLKARAIAELAGCMALADDSGICVDALGGAPGVYSARWSGGGDGENNRKMLADMAGRADRSAHYACVMALAGPDGFLLTAEGRCDGRIALEPKGSGGFGYDPLFIPDGYTCTMAELPAEEKHGISHRGRALRALLEMMRGQP